MVHYRLDVPGWDCEYQMPRPTAWGQLLANINYPMVLTGTQLLKLGGCLSTRPSFGDQREIMELVQICETGPL